GFHVTGVQTCALPISFQNEQEYLFSSSFSELEETRGNYAEVPPVQKRAALTGSFGIQLETRLFEKKSQVNLVINHNDRNSASARSEERRVGKECRSQS